MRSSGLNSRRPFKGIVLTQRHRAQRLRWARTMNRGVLRRWTKVLCSDESRFSLQGPDGRIHVWRRRNERLANCCVEENDRFGGGGSVMVWAGIAASRKTQLVFIDGNLNAARYRDEILENHVKPFFNNNPNITEFQQDNAPPHTARITQQYLQQNNITTMDWPSKSPDLSPIENAWDYLGRKVKARANIPRTIAELKIALRQEWNAIPQHYLRKLFNSMPRRLRACINAHGGHTGY